VQYTRTAAHWLTCNTDVFMGDVQLPSIVQWNDDHVAAWAQRSTAAGATYNELRDVTLMSFSDVNDISTFMSLVNVGLGIPAAVCLDGEQYIADNAEWLNL